MKHLIPLKRYFLFILFAFLAVSCEEEEETVALAGGGDEVEAESNIVETAQATPDLSSLVAALAKADENEDSDLIGTLSGDGPFTVFAPTNAAFTELLNGLDGFDSLEDFDTPEERTLLATILQYHVVAGAAVKSTDLEDDQEITTVQGEDVEVDLEDGVFIEDATDDEAEVIIPDVMPPTALYM